MAVYVTGFEQLRANLKNELEGLKARTLEGMIQAAEEVKDDMDMKSPTIPIKYQNLERSWFIVSTRGVHTGNSFSFTGKEADKEQAHHAKTIADAMSNVSANPGSLDVEFGFGTKYAIWVHEMVEPKNWTRAGSGAKFLEIAIGRKKREMLKTIQQVAYIKGYGLAGEGKGGHTGRIYMRDIRTERYVTR